MNYIIPINEDNKMDLDESSNINMKDLDLNNKKNINNQNNEYDFDYGFDENKILFEIESYQSCLEFIEYIFDPAKQEEILNISFINGFL